MRDEYHVHGSLSYTFLAFPNVANIIKTAADAGPHVEHWYVRSELIKTRWT
jgi:hypothetical protein